MTSQTYTHFICTHMRDLEWRRLQLTWAHKSVYIMFEIISTLL